MNSPFLRKPLSLLYFLLVLQSVVNAQSLTNLKWKVAEYGIAADRDYGLNPNHQPLIVFFSKDSLHNVVDYSNISFEFFSNGSYEGKNVLGQTYQGLWLLNNNGDSLSIDTNVYLFHFINTLTCITKNATYQVIDTLGTIDTLYSYVKLFAQATTSIAEKESYVHLFPMPASDYINVEIKNNDFNAVNTQLINLYGQVVKTWSLTDRKKTYYFDIKELPPGYYLLEFTTVDGIRMTQQKLIKQ